jgi:hypothetical protein
MRIVAAKAKSPAQHTMFVQYRPARRAQWDAVRVLVLCPVAGQLGAIVADFVPAQATDFCGALAGEQQ